MAAAPKRLRVQAGFGKSTAIAQAVRDNGTDHRQGEVEDLVDHLARATEAPPAVFHVGVVADEVLDVAPGAERRAAPVRTTARA